MHQADLDLKGAERDARGRGARGARGAPGRVALTEPIPDRLPPLTRRGIERSYELACALFAAFISRDVRRAAAFLWMTPLDAGLVDPLLGEDQPLGRVLGPRLGRRGGALDPGLELGTDGEVAHPPLLVLDVALLLALDVRHRVSRPHCVSGTGKGYQRGRRSRPFAANQAHREGQWASRPRFRPDVYVIPLDRLRCLSIIAHIDHGKSTLADRILEITGAVEMRDMRAQYLDSMDIERERGITIKAQNVRLNWKDHVISLIDTPGHVDFGYEVSRSLAACEGVILLVDASQGIEAQTLANCYLAIENDLAIVAAVNKIDLPAADPDRVSEEIERVLGIAAEDVLRISAKTGDGVPELLDAVLETIPAPTG